MNKNTRLWVRALKSGKYPQGEGRLSRGGKYCCLGVACELYQELVGDLRIGRNSTTTVTYNGKSLVLPKAVENWLGMRSDCGFFTHEDQHCSLDSVNDDWGYTFSQIADLIVEKKKELFYEPKR